MNTKVLALNFSDDESDPDQLGYLERLIPKVGNGRYVVQSGTSTSPGHYTMSRPDLWASHVAEFREWTGSGFGESKN